MKTRLVSVFLTMIVAVLTFAFAPRLAAQNGVQRKHHHYKLIDLGTLGGPSAYKSVNAPGYQILNDAEDVSFAADTSTRDPNYPANPNLWANPDCFVSHATLTIPAQLAAVSTTMHRAPAIPDNPVLQIPQRLGRRWMPWYRALGASRRD